MRPTILLFVCALLTLCLPGASTRAQEAGWVEVYNRASPQFIDVEMADDLRGVAFTPKSMLRTSDGARTWNETVAETMYHDGEIAFHDANIGWVVNGGGIWRTESGGASWLKVSAGGGVGLAVVDDNEGWVIGGIIDIYADIATCCHAAGSLRRTRDGGATWQDVAITGVSGFHVVAFAGRFGWVAGTTCAPGSDLRECPRLENEVLVHTEDGGDTWSVLAKSPGFVPSNMRFVDANVGYATLEGLRTTGYVSGFYRTDDGGRTWQQLSPPAAATAGLVVRSPLDVWLAGPDCPVSPPGGACGSLIAHTQDGGETWQNIEGPPISLAAFDVTSTGIVVAQYNQILLRNPTDTAWTPAVTETGPGFYDPVFVSRTTGIAVLADASRGSLRTTDGGETWAHAEVPAGDELLSAGPELWIKSQHCGAGGCITDLSRSDDAGATWRSVDRLPPPGQLVAVATGGRGWMLGRTPAGGGPRDLWRTDDGGHTWNAVHSFAPGINPHVRFVDRDFGWAIGCEQQPCESYVVTHDGGETWSPRPLSPGDDPVFISSSTGWVRVVLNEQNRCPCRDALFQTVDGGVTWREVYRAPPGVFHLDTLKFIDSLRGWSFNDGTLWHTEDGGRTWSRELDYDGFAQSPRSLSVADGRAWLTASEGVVLGLGDRTHVYRRQIAPAVIGPETGNAGGPGARDIAAALAAVAGALAAGAALALVAARRRT